MVDTAIDTKDGLSLFGYFVALHKLQLESSDVPAHFWESLFKKLNEQIFDAGNSFTILEVQYDDDRKAHEPFRKAVVQCPGGVSASDPNNIFLIDHAWTYRLQSAKQNLREIPGLVSRMATLMGIDINLYEDREVLIEDVLKEMWKFNRPYSLGSVSNIEDRMPVWYILDEFGSAIEHSDNPNFRLVPFIFVPEGVTYSLLFPIKNVLDGEEVTVDYIECINDDSDKRKAMLIPWYPTSFIEHTHEHTEPDEKYFLEGHAPETLPNYDNLETLPLIDTDRKLKVYSDYSFVNIYLTHPKFEITSDETEADILWYVHHFKNYKDLSEKTKFVYINQFPYENVITIKDLLSIVCHRKADKSANNISKLTPLWLPETYNLKTELPKFVSYFQQREKLGLDNHWICKPWNLARGLDTCITDNLNCIVKLPLGGPKIAQKYIENPVLFYRENCGKVKFDVRYVILLKSVQPLSAYVYKNFFLRFANIPFSLSEFDVYEKHFTVMNYNEHTPLYRMLCHDFIKNFEDQYPAFKWADVELNICNMLKEMFEGAVINKPPKGIAHSPQSRALYAADIMLSWECDNENEQYIQPKLLEMNWTPDCQRACEYYNDFYNDVFRLLFLDEELDTFIKL